MGGGGTLAAARSTGASALGLAHAVADHARQRPEAIALVWHGERTTYRRLHEMAVAAHAQLTASALPPGPLTVLSKKSPETVALVLGCLMARRAFLLPSVDLGTETLSQLLGAVGGVASLSTRAEAGARHAPLVTHWLSPDSGDGSASPSDEPPEPGPDATTFMLTTSGSTGMPKVVPLSAGAVDRFTSWAATAFGIAPGVTVLNYAPLNFDLCLLDVWATLRAGGCVALVDQDHAANPRHLRRLILDAEPQVIQAVPMLYELLREASGTDQSFDTVRDVIFTGDVLPDRTRRALPRLFPSARFHNVYGCTETNDSFVLSLEADELAADSPVSLGDPIPGVSALVVDDAGNVLEGPGTGELWVATPFQTVGYLGEAAHSRKFARPRVGHDRVHFRTGDIVERAADGRVSLLGRNDHQLKVRGVRVNLLEVEAAISAYGEVREAAVVALPDEVASNVLHALVVPQEGAEVGSLALRAHCAERLPRAAIPSTFVVVDDALPRNANGKVDRREIAARLRRIEGGTDG